MEGQPSHAAATFLNGGFEPTSNAVSIRLEDAGLCGASWRVSSLLHLSICMSGRGTAVERLAAASRRAPIEKNRQHAWSSTAIDAEADFRQYLGLRPTPVCRERSFEITARLRRQRQMADGPRWSLCRRCTLCRSALGWCADPPDMRFPGAQLLQGKAVADGEAIPRPISGTPMVQTNVCESKDRHSLQISSHVFDYMRSTRMVLCFRRDGLTGCLRFRQHYSGCGRCVHYRGERRRTRSQRSDSLW